MNDTVVAALVGGLSGALVAAFGFITQWLSHHWQSTITLRRFNLERLAQKQFAFYTAVCPLLSQLYMSALGLVSFSYRSAKGFVDFPPTESVSPQVLSRQLKALLDEYEVFIPAIVVTALTDVCISEDNCRNALSIRTADAFNCSALAAIDTVRKSLGVDRVHKDLMRSLKECDAVAKVAPMYPILEEGLGQPGFGAAEFRPVQPDCSRGQPERIANSVTHP